MLFAWSGAAIAGQMLPFAALLVYCATWLVIAALMAPGRLWQLIRRSRFLLLALLVLFALFTPGERVFDAPQWLPLTHEGLRLCTQQLARVMCVIALVALLLERLHSAELVQGIILLAAPLRWLGGDPERLAVRLSLVLWMVAEAKAPNWREWLSDPRAGETMPSIKVPRRSFGTVDAILLALLLILVPTCLILIA